MLRHTRNPLEFLKAAGNIAKLGKEAQKTPGSQKEAWRNEAYTNRWKNFWWTLVFIGAIKGFLWVGFRFKSGFNIIGWYIYMGFGFLLLLIGIITWFWYLGLIIKYRGK